MTTEEIIQDNIKNQNVVAIGVKRITHIEWVKRFKPIKVLPETEAEPDGYGFVDTGQGKVVELIETTPDNRIWTLVQAFEAYYITPGCNRDNGALSTYYICEVPCEDYDLQVREEVRRYCSREATKKVVEIDDLEKSRLGAAASCDWLLDLADILEYSPESADQQLVDEIRMIVNRIQFVGFGFSIGPKW